MLKKLFTFIFVFSLVLSYGQGMRKNVQKFDGRNPAKHPLFAVLESDSFTPQERARLKALAAKDMKAFTGEMRKHFKAHKKAEATKILALRKQIREAKNPDEKKKLTEQLRAELKKRAEKRLAFHKRLLDETERNLQAMQKRCNQLKKEYDIRKNSKDQLIEKEMKEILSDNPPKYLERSANWDPGKPMPPMPPRKNRR